MKKIEEKILQNWYMQIWVIWKQVISNYKIYKKLPQKILSILSTYSYKVIL